jgi:acetyl-CoA carboxylase biotin carboxyl carrier protein
VNVARIEELIELMRRSRVTELSLEVTDCKLRLRRREGAEVAPAALAPAPAAGEPAPLTEPETVSTGPVRVPSPVVGIFHSRGAEARPLGARVTVGDLLGTVEAMKVPNEVRSPVTGALAAVLVEEGQAVEFGQPLFAILPQGGGEVDESEAAVG